MHTILLNGRSVLCCCGEPIADEYYQFEAIDHAGNVVNLLYAEHDCAQRLLRLSQASGVAPITLLPLFNPLKPLEVDDRHRLESERHGDDATVSPLAVELEQAIYLTLLCWGGTFKDKRRIFPAA